MKALFLCQSTCINSFEQSLTMGSVFPVSLCQLSWSPGKPPDRFLAVMQCPPSQGCPFCCVSQKSEAGCGWNCPGFARAIMISLRWQQHWARGFTGTQYVCVSWLRRAPCKAHLFQQASYNQIGCLATQSQIMDI